MRRRVKRSSARSHKVADERSGINLPGLAIMTIVNPQPSTMVHCIGISFLSRFGHV